MQLIRTLIRVGKTRQTASGKTVHDIVVQEEAMGQGALVEPGERLENRDGMEKEAHQTAICTIKNA